MVPFEKFLWFINDSSSHHNLFHKNTFTEKSDYQMSQAGQNQRNYMCAQQSLRSAWASAGQLLES